MPDTEGSHTHQPGRPAKRLHRKRQAQVATLCMTGATAFMPAIHRFLSAPVSTLGLICASGMSSLWAQRSRWWGYFARFVAFLTAFFLAQRFAR
jgi:hypothetical protein